MVKKNENRIATINHRFPSLELVTTLAFVVIMIISIREYLNGSQVHLIFVPILLLIFVGIYFLTNWKNKSVIIKPDCITIKRPLRLKDMTLQLNQIKGYELREIVSGYGLIKNVRIITSEDKKIEFFRDTYTEIEYQRLINGLKKSNLNYLGTSELESKNKKLYASIGKWGLIVAMILFGLLQVVKIFK